MDGHRRHYETRHTSEPDDGPFPGAVHPWAPARRGDVVEPQAKFGRASVLEDWDHDAGAAADGVLRGEPLTEMAASASRALASIDELREEIEVAGYSADRSACPDRGYPTNPELAGLLTSAQQFAERAAVTAEEQAHHALAIVDEVDRLRDALELFTRRNEELVRELRRLSHTLTAHTPSITGA